VKPAACAAVAVFLAAASCGGGRPSPAARQALPRVRTVAVSERTAEDQTTSFGSISFQKKADVTALVDGTVAELPLGEGDTVRRGDLLARLENIQLDLRRKQALSTAGSARSELDLAEARLWEGQLQVEARVATVQRAELELESRRRELEELARSLRNKEQLLSAGGTTEEATASVRLSYASGRTAVQLLEKDLEIRRIGLRDEDIVSRGLAVPRDEAARRRVLVRIGTLTLAAERDVARARAEAAEAELGSVEQLIAELAVRAPLSGIVGARYVEAGEHAAANTKLFTLISTGEVYAVFPVPEAEAHRVRVGDPVEVRVDALGDAVFRGRVALVSPVIDPQAGTVTVKAVIADAGTRMKPGMFARVRLRHGAGRPVTVIPSSAIAQRQGSAARVFAVVNRRVFLKEATLGAETEGGWIVEKGLAPGERVVDSPSLLLKEGEEVEAE
jgi:HlyD family secretion protein